MNIFILDESPELCARYHVDKHVVKMILETAQLMSTAIRMAAAKKSDEDAKVASELGIYKATHPGHPCTIWAKESSDNFLWLAELGKALGTEYTFRYGKQHKSIEVIDKCVEFVHLINKGKITKFAQAMPEKYKGVDAVEAYRAYYVGDKFKMAKWKNRPIPVWWKEPSINNYFKETVNDGN